MKNRALRVILILALGMFCSGLSVSPGEAKTFTDTTGCTVTVPDRPLRVVSLAPSITEIVFSLEKGSFLTGVTRYSDYPEAAKKLPRVGSYIRPELETIVSLKPDLCLAVKDGNPEKVVERIKAFGIPVYTVNPDGIDTIIRSINEIGDLLNATYKARAITGAMEAQLASIDRAIAGVAHKPRLFFQIGISPIVSVGTHTFLDEMIRRAGGENIVTSKTPYPRFSKEQVLALAPEMIIITSMARNDDFESVKQGWESWPSLPAVQMNNIHIVNSDILDRPTPRVVDGLAMLAALIHPTLFKEAVR
ncbi:ABC transporter substrate-binding protein [Desulfoluna spongiiphila]|uniref:Iron complex transport system substrate-binding protein n=1 Tax=Desulfoluna spongiiphila TaxID=419481 RepID=A0A1G5FF55_9BACT|nr:cobalamin-binding protein [Desulfoluna spongiiphila]SCY37510.1 iron complex transport system substrate-binding protein [Desulfoluna spongiiphila]